MDVTKTGWILTICLLLSLPGAPVRGAESDARPGGLVSASFGPAGLGLPVGRLVTTLHYKFMETDGVRYHRDELNDNGKLTKHIGIVKLRYGLAPGLDIRSSIQVYDIERRNRKTGETDNLGSVGDATLSLHAVLLDQGRGAPFSLAVDTAAVLPTASVSDKSVDSLGNRAWGAGFGVGFTRFMRSHRFDQEFHYFTFTEGEHDYRNPDRLRCNTAWTWALNKYVDVGVESLFEWNGESERNNQRRDDSKREWYVGPKLSFKHQPTAINAGVLIGYPVYRWYENPKGTPSDGYRFEIKLSKVFDLP